MLRFLHLAFVNSKWQSVILFQAEDVCRCTGYLNLAETQGNGLKNRKKMNVIETFKAKNVLDIVFKAMLCLSFGTKRLPWCPQML